MKSLYVILILAALVLATFVFIGCGKKKDQTHNESLNDNSLDGASPLDISPGELLAKAHSEKDIMTWIKYMENNIRNKKVIWNVKVESVKEVSIKGLAVKYQISANDNEIFIFGNDEKMLALKKGEDIIIEGLIQKCSTYEKPYIEVYPAKIK